MKKILITGSLSYIGSALTPYLAKEGFDCTGIDVGFFKDCLLYPAQDCRTIFKDVRNLTKNDLSGFETVIHLAGISNDPFKNFDPKLIYDPTRDYTLEIAKMCKKLGIKFIFSSSCSVYGRGGKSLVNETSPTYPQTPYSLNKLQIEEGLKKITDNNFSPIIFRFATVFGLSPRMRFDLVVNMFIGMALTTKKITLNSNGLAWRPHVHLRDVCQAVKMAIDFNPPPNQTTVLNVGDSSQNHQIIEIAKMVQKILPETEIVFLNQQDQKDELVKDRKIQDGVDSRDYKVSCELIKKTLPGFKCKWTLQKTIPDMIDQLHKLKLTENQFKNISFYRLQKFEQLIKNGYLSKNLFWLKQN